MFVCLPRFVNSQRLGQCFAVFAMVFPFFGALPGGLVQHDFFFRLRYNLGNGLRMLIRNGNIDEGGLKRERLTVNELLGKLREKGYADPKDIDIALIEESGQISVIPKSEASIACSIPLSSNF